MMNLASEVLELLHGKTLVTAESITGGGIGEALTAIPGASAVYKGGIISYCDDVKASVLGVSRALLHREGAVSAPVAEAMAHGARRVLDAEVAVSVTGLAGPDGDEYGHPVGTVFIGYADAVKVLSREFQFFGDRETVRCRTVQEALKLVLEESK